MSTEPHPTQSAPVNALEKRAHYTSLRLWHVLLLAFVLRAALMVLAAPWNPDVVDEVVLQSDAKGYHILANYLLEHGSFEPEPIRTPGYVVMVAAIYSIVGERPAVVIFLQILLDVIVCYCCFRLIRHLFGERAGLMGALLYAINPTAVLYANTLMSDALFVLLLVVSVSLFFRAMEVRSGRRSLGYFVTFALCLGLAALTRPVALYLMPLFMLLVGWVERRNLRTVVPKIALASILFVGVISPWVYRNYVTFGVIGLSSSGAFNTFQLYAVSTEMYRLGMNAAQAELNIRAEYGRDAWPSDRLNDYQRHVVLAGIGRQYLVQHPKWFAWATALGIGQMYWSTGTGSFSQLLNGREQKVNISEEAAQHGIAGAIPALVQKKTTGELIIGAVVMLMHLVEYMLVLVGLWQLRRQLLRPQVMILVAMIVGYSLMIGAAGIMRFKLPVIPFYLAFAGVGAVYVLEICRSRGWFAAGSATAVKSPARSAQTVL
jgi:4-amino-4-deoxy-L-arabinose transferase-like glycosyltransferase